MAFNAKTVNPKRLSLSRCYSKWFNWFVHCLSCFHRSMSSLSFRLKQRCLLFKLREVYTIKDSIKGIIQHCWATYRMACKVWTLCTGQQSLLSWLSRSSCVNAKVPSLPTPRTLIPWIVYANSSSKSTWWNGLHGQCWKVPSRATWLYKQGRGRGSHASYLGYTDSAALLFAKSCFCWYLISTPSHPCPFLKSVCSLPSCLLLKSTQIQSHPSMDP